MASSIQHKRSTTAGVAPLAAEALEGEILINLVDKKIYSKDHNGSIILLLDGGNSINIVNNLLEVNSGSALDATQGKLLKDMIDNINTLLSSDDTTLDEIQEIVDFIKTNKSTLDSLAIGNIAGLQTALDGKEPTFAKLTAFNKNFGTGGDDVARGNHSHDAGTYNGA